MGPVVAAFRRLLLKNWRAGQIDKLPSAGEAACCWFGYNCFFWLWGSSYWLHWAPKTCLCCGEERQVGEQALCQKFGLSFGTMEIVFSPGSGPGGRLGCSSNFIPLSFYTVVAPFFYSRGILVITGYFRVLYAAASTSQSLLMKNMYYCKGVWECGLFSEISIQMCS